MKLKVLIGAFALTLAACHSSDPRFMARPVPPKPESPLILPTETQGAAGDKQVISSTFNVDILFIIDDSESMDKYQERLQRNVSQLPRLSRSQNQSIFISVSRRSGILRATHWERSPPWLLFSHLKCFD